MEDNVVEVTFTIVGTTTVPSEEWIDVKACLEQGILFKALEFDFDLNVLVMQICKCLGNISDV